jgi:DNA-directed RNA polymerase subunit RPC12/RpoP
MTHYHNLICTSCYAERVPPARRKLGYVTCMSCGEKQASKVRHTVAPLNKGNYMLFTDMDLLKQLNPKRTT